MFLKQKFNYRTYSRFDMPFLKRELVPLRYEKAEERELIKRTCRGDRLARRRLVEGALEMVQSIAAQYDHTREPLEDLVAEGTLGLMRAVDRVSDHFDNLFSTYASWFVHSAISDYLDKRGLMRLPKSVVLKVRVYLKAKERLEKADLPAKKPDLARELGVSLKKLEEWDKAGLFLAGKGKQEIIREAGPQKENLEDIYGGKEDRRFQEIEQMDFIKIGLGNLDKQAAYVIASLLALDTPRKSIRELAKELKLSEERIRQLRKQGIRKLRKSNLAI